ncbi:MAG: hypothetical protein R3B65_01950 [Candidatus Paceibacterota bacterium]
MFICIKKNGWQKTLDNSEFEDFDIKKFNEYSKIGEKTKEYFKEKIKNNEEPLIFHMIPHILYKGNIDTSNLEIISTYPEL